MLIHRNVISVALLLGLAGFGGGCSAGTPVEPPQAGTQTLILHVDGMT